VQISQTVVFQGGFFCLGRSFPFPSIIGFFSFILSGPCCGPCNNPHQKKKKKKYIAFMSADACLRMECSFSLCDSFYSYGSPD